MYLSRSRLRLPISYFSLKKQRIGLKILKFLSCQSRFFLLFVDFSDSSRLAVEVPGFRGWMPWFLVQSFHGSTVCTACTTGLQWEKLVKPAAHGRHRKSIKVMYSEVWSICEKRCKKKVIGKKFIENPVRTCLCWRRVYR